VGEDFEEHAIGDLRGGGKINFEGAQYRRDFGAKALASTCG
jgi:hypothetical protein